MDRSGRHNDLPSRHRSAERVTKAVALLFAAALVAAACGADAKLTLPDPDADTTDGSAEAVEPGPTPSPTPVPTPTPEPEGRAVLPDDLELETGPRLAVQTTDDQIVTLLGDGTNLVPLTNPAEGTRNVQPTWSPDSNRLAWITLDPSGDDHAVRAARFDGSAWSSTDVGGAPVYLAWDPTGTQVASLSTSGQGFDLGVVDLGVVEVDETPGYQVVDSGAPLFFSWGPDADAFLVHGSGIRLDLVPIDGSPRVLEQVPGQFQTPVWLPGPTPLIYADRVDDENFLVVAGEEGSGRRALITYDGYLQFAVNEPSAYIAVQVIDESRAPLPEVITASAQVDPDQTFVDIVDPIPQDQLALIATFGGDPLLLHPVDPLFGGPASIDDDPVVAFWWAADGSTLAWVVERDPGDGACDSGTARYQWKFWQNDLPEDGPTFIPSAVFACEYLPFFDQYGQSITYFSPDNSEMVYAGTDPDTGEEGIWKVDLTNLSAAPTFLTDGVHAVWSPEQAGSAAASAL